MGPEFRATSLQSSPTLGVRAGVTRRRAESWTSLELRMDWTSLREADRQTEFFAADFERAGVFLGGQAAIDVEPDWACYVRIAVGVEWLRADPPRTPVVIDRSPAVRLGGGLVRDLGAIAIGTELGWAAADHDYRPIRELNYPHQFRAVEVLLTMRTSR